MRPALRPALLAFLLLPAFAAPADAQRLPWPGAPADYSWLLEPALLATYVATAVPTGLAPYAGDPGAYALLGAGYVFGPLAGWAVAGDVQRGAGWAGARAVLYGGAVATFVWADYQGWEDFFPAAGHTLLATVVLSVPYGIDVATLDRHVRPERRRAFAVMPVLAGDAVGMSAQLRW